MKIALLVIALTVVLTGCSTTQVKELNESICAREAEARGAAQAVIDYLDATCPYVNQPKGDIAPGT